MCRYIELSGIMRILFVHVIGKIYKNNNNNLQDCWFCWLSSSSFGGVLQHYASMAVTHHYFFMNRCRLPQEDVTHCWSTIWLCTLAVPTCVVFLGKALKRHNVLHLPGLISHLWLKLCIFRPLNIMLLLSCSLDRLVHKFDKFSNIYHFAL